MWLAGHTCVQYVCHFPSTTIQSPGFQHGHLLRWFPWQFPRSCWQKQQFNRLLLRLSKSVLAESQKNGMARSSWSQKAFLKVSWGRGGGYTTRAESPWLWRFASNLYWKKASSTNYTATFWEVGILPSNYHVCPCIWKEDSVLGEMLSPNTIHFYSK